VERVTPARPEVAAEVIREWFDRYNAAWDAGDIATIENLVDPSLNGAMIMMDGETTWQVTYDGDIAGVRGFLRFAAAHDVRTTVDLLDVTLRSDTEAILTSRKTVAIRDGADPRVTVQLAIETVRRDAHGTWRLMRYWAEKAVIGNLEGNA
jgi:hypothetical protein